MSRACCYTDVRVLVAEFDPLYRGKYYEGTCLLAVNWLGSCDILQIRS